MRLQDASDGGTDRVVAAYAERLGHAGPLRPDLATLRSIHRAWRTRVPYENVDIQLGRSIELGADALVDKFVRRRRGGFCYEMNGALALLLRGIGFEVAFCEGAVLRETRGESMWGNHVGLLVELDGETWLADTGIGDAFLEPLPFREGSHEQDGGTYRVERLDDAVWRVHHRVGGSIPSFDLRPGSVELSDFATRARELSTSPESAFVQVLVLQHHRDGVELALRSRVLTRTGPAGTSRRTLEDEADLAATLEEFRVPVADLGADGVRRLWERSGEQYAAWLEIERRDGSGPA